MKNKLFKLGLWVILLFPAYVLADQGVGINYAEYARDILEAKRKIEPIEDLVKPKPYSLHPDIEFQEGGQLYICFEGDLDSLQRSHYAIIDGEARSNPVPLNAFTADNGTRNIAIDNTFVHLHSKIKNTAEGISLFNTKIRAQDTDERGSSSNRIIASEGEKIPYLDYIAAGSDSEPCDKNRVRYGTITVDKDFDWLVVQLITKQEPTPDPEVAPPAAPEFQENAAPQSGGCSMSTVIPGAKYGLSILFSLILGAHALLRFRRK